MNAINFNYRNELRAHRNRQREAMRSNRGDNIVGAVGIVGCVVILLLVLAGVK